jgi:hypothetical protein
METVRGKQHRNEDIDVLHEPFLALTLVMCPQQNVKHCLISTTILTVYDERHRRIGLVVVTRRQTPYVIDMG